MPLSRVLYVLAPSGASFICVFPPPISVDYGFTIQLYPLDTLPTYLGCYMCPQEYPGYQSIILKECQMLLDRTWVPLVGWQRHLRRVLIVSRKVLCASRRVLSVFTEWLQEGSGVSTSQGVSWMPLVGCFHINIIQLACHNCMSQGIFIYFYCTIYIIFYYIFGRIGTKLNHLLQWESEQIFSNFYFIRMSPGCGEVHLKT